MTRRLLVTGGAGFIGSNFVLRRLERQPDDRLVVLDALTYAGNRTNLAAATGQPSFRFVHGDIRDQALVESLLREEELDTIVHFAAESHVDRSISGPDIFIEVNVQGTHALLKAARQVWLGDDGPARHRFHHVSTDEVYGSLDGDDPPFTETTPYAPNSPYAASKAASDHLVRAYRHTYGLETTISNCSNNYGPFHFPEKLIPLVIVNLLTGKPLPIYGQGLNVRDWLHVYDHCLGIERILSHGAAGETYNIGGDNEWANIDLVRELCRVVDELFVRRPELAALYPDASAARGEPSENSIEFVTDRPGHDQRYAIDARKIRDELDFQTETRFPDGLRQTVTWYVDHPEWWRAVMDQSYREWIAEQYTPERAGPPG